MKHLFVLLIFICFAAFNQLYAQQTLYGDTLNMGNGIVYTWAQYNNQGNRELIGFSLTQGALNNLPASSISVSSTFPVSGSDTLFNHIFLNWNPFGHPPSVWNVPHFDVHFMMVSIPEREAVVGGLDSLIPPQYIPPDYFKETEVIPGMGSHWADSTSPELNGFPATYTMIYGFYRKKMLFVEPMITRAYLLTNPNDSAIIKQPAQYLRTGYFPTKYTIKYDAVNQKYDIVIKEFVFRVATPIGVNSISSHIPDNFNLYQNYPNPFNPKTKIKFDLPDNSFVNLTIFNSLGQKVSELINNDLKSGTYEVDWNANDLSSGLYFYTMTTGDFTVTKKMLLIK